MIHRRPLPARRNHITPTVRIAGQRAFYLSVHEDAPVRGNLPLRKRFGLFFRIDRPPRQVGLHTEILPQPGPLIELLGNLFSGAKCVPLVSVFPSELWS